MTQRATSRALFLIAVIFAGLSATGCEEILSATGDLIERSQKNTGPVYYGKGWTWHYDGCADIAYGTYVVSDGGNNRIVDKLPLGTIWEAKQKGFDSHESYESIGCHDANGNALPRR